MECQRETPVVAMPGKRQSISAASAVNAKGGFWFATYQGAISAELFIEMLKILMNTQKALVLDPRQLTRPPRKDRERLCRVDERKIAVLLSTRLRTSDGIRTEIIELQKLLFEAVLHPMSFLTSSVL
jgi:hypothetical protein